MGIWTETSGMISKIWGQSSWEKPRSEPLPGSRQVKPQRLASSPRKGKIEQRKNKPYPMTPGLYSLFVGRQNIWDEQRRHLQWSQYNVDLAQDTEVSGTNPIEGSTSRRHWAPPHLGVVPLSQSLESPIHWWLPHDTGTSLRTVTQSYSVAVFQSL